MSTQESIGVGAEGQSARSEERSEQALPATPAPDILPSERIRLYMQIAVSAVSMVAGITLVVTAEAEPLRQVGTGWVGIVIGFWLGD